MSAGRQLTTGIAAGPFRTHTLPFVTAIMTYLLLPFIEVAATVFDRPTSIIEVNLNAEVSPFTANKPMNEPSFSTAMIPVIPDCEGITINTVPVVPWDPVTISTFVAGGLVYYTDGNIWKCTQRKKCRNSSTTPGSEKFAPGVLNGWTFVRSCVTVAPTGVPSLFPSGPPTNNPTHSPTSYPSGSPSDAPMSLPSFSPSYICGHRDWVGGTNYDESDGVNPGDRVVYNEIIWECTNRKGCDKLLNVPGSSGTNNIWRPIERCVTVTPSLTPSRNLTGSPTKNATFSPVNLPTSNPTVSPTNHPMEYPSTSPT
ncbi:hypothetical protein ACHAXS_001125, partial [Conticribra weissflogii]